MLLFRVKRVIDNYKCFFPLTWKGALCAFPFAFSLSMVAIMAPVATLGPKVVFAAIASPTIILLWSAYLTGQVAAKHCGKNIFDWFLFFGGFSGGFVIATQLIFQMASGW